MNVTAQVIKHVSMSRICSRRLRLQEKYRRDSDAFDKMPRPRNGDDNISSTQRRAREILIRHAIVTQGYRRSTAEQPSKGCYGFR